jgi:sulfite exporter TauE/SafE
VTELFASAPVWTAALVMGLLGSPHCVGMCGGIATALAPAPAKGADARRPVRDVVIGVALGVGRIATYAALGAVAGGLGRVVVGGAGSAAGPLLRVALGVLLVGVGLSIAGWWPGALAGLERVGARVWEALAPVARHVVPVDDPLRALAAGALWGLLPCGLVYAALAGAAASGSPVDGAGWMTAFGLGTLPAVLGAGWMAGRLRQWTRRVEVRRVAGVVLLASGVWTAVAPIGMRHGSHQHAAGHGVEAEATPAPAEPGRAHDPTDPHAGHH